MKREYSFFLSSGLTEFLFSSVLATYSSLFLCFLTPQATTEENTNGLKERKKPVEVASSEIDQKQTDSTEREMVPQQATGKVQQINTKAIEYTEKQLQQKHRGSTEQTTGKQQQEEKAHPKQNKTTETESEKQNESKERKRRAEEMEKGQLQTKETEKVEQKQSESKERTQDKSQLTQTKTKELQQTKSITAQQTRNEPQKESLKRLRDPNTHKEVGDFVDSPKTKRAKHEGGTTDEKTPSKKRVSLSKQVQSPLKKSTSSLVYVLHLPIYPLYSYSYLLISF